jgi:hypothetical protein
MGCAIIDIEVTKPLPCLSLNEGQTGFAVIIRRKGKPIGFWLDAPATKKTLQPGELGRRITAEMGRDLLAEARQSLELHTGIDAVERQRG